MNEPSKSLDILGIKPIGDALNTLTKGTVQGAAAFLSRICLPAAEEFGLLLRDRVGAWRANNAAAIIRRAEESVSPRQDAASLSAHPRIVAGVVELGSWSDAEEVQQMWAGLLASACTPDGRDDSNLMFIDLLAKLTVSQARLFDYACKNSKKELTPAGWLAASELPMSIADLLRVAGLTDFHRLDLELDHLRTLGLLTTKGGFMAYSHVGDLSPSPLALQMYARCRGHFLDPLTFYGVQPPPAKPPQVQ